MKTKPVTRWMAKSPKGKLWGHTYSYRSHVVYGENNLEDKTYRQFMARCRKLGWKTVKVKVME